MSRANFALQWQLPRYTRLVAHENRFPIDHILDS
jgi:hypothetical protein